MRCGFACDGGIFRRHIHVPTKNGVHRARRPAGRSATARRCVGAPNSGGLLLAKAACALLPVWVDTGIVEPWTAKPHVSCATLKDAFGLQPNYLIDRSTRFFIGRFIRPKYLL